MYSIEGDGDWRPDCSRDVVGGGEKEMKKGKGEEGMAGRNHPRNTGEVILIVLAIIDWYFINKTLRR